MNKLVLSKPSVSMIQKGLVTTRNFVITKSPIILAAIGVGGVVTTGVMAYRAGIKAEQIQHDLIDDTFQTEARYPTTEEIVKATWKVWIPPVVSGALTIGAIIGSTAISEKRRAALAGLYAVSEAALKEYQEKTEEVVGKKKEQEIRDRVNESKAVDADPPWEVAPSGVVWVLDRWTGREFQSTVERIRSAANELNSRILNGDLCASYNDFYEEIGLKGCEMGTECGWNLNHLCNPYFTSTLTSDMRPILVLDWDRGNTPSVNYRDI